ncbi:MAG: anti-sigma factor [Xanthobacteraceae bacterium]|nr:anti-sigma factor [Xanthobacteraceae bacterium]
MTKPNIPVTEDELHAYVDGELPAERRADVEAWLAAHPDDADRVGAWRAMADALHARYGGVTDEPVPARLNVDRLARPPRRWLHGAIAASLLAFAAGGGAGWFAHGATAAPSSFRSFTADAIEAHRLYVVEVRHPVEVAASERTHMQQWLSKRVGYSVKAPELDGTGLKLVGGRLLPGPRAPAAFLMYEGPSGERYTLYTSRASTPAAQMRYATQADDGALYWADRGIGYVLTGPDGNKARLEQVARAVYDQTEKTGG